MDQIISYSQTLVETSGGFSSLLSAVWAAWTAYKNRPKAGEPPRAQYKIPFIGHGLQLVRDPISLLNDCSKKYGDTFSILVFVREVMRAPDRQLSFSDAVNHIVDIGFCFGDSTPVNRYHIPPMRKNLGKNLERFVPRLWDAVQDAFNSHVPLSTKSGTCLKDVTAFAYRTIARTTSSCMFENKEFQVNDEIRKMLFTVSVDATFFSSLKRMLPYSIACWIARSKTRIYPNIKLADEVFAPEVRRRRAEAEQLGDDYVAPYDIMQWLIDDRGKDGEPYAAHDLGRRMLQVGFASMLATANFTTHILFDIAGYPHIQEMLQREQDDIIKRFGDTITMDIIKEMHFLDACIRETLRLNGDPTNSFRLAMSDVTLSNGFYIPKGRLCSIHGYSIHSTPDVYGAESRCTNALKSTVSDDHHVHTSINIHISLYYRLQFTSESFVVFGIGSHTCPGRFLATLEMKIVAIYALRNYSFSTLSGKRPGNAPRNGMTMAPIDEPILFVPRANVH
ncbi:cytochrome P450 [Syncephalis plumigaleata]|nr:cytochrome P450 [Syncephalis plumigaleata]